MEINLKKFRSNDNNFDIFSATLTETEHKQTERVEWSADPLSCLLLTLSAMSALSIGLAVEWRSGIAIKAKHAIRSIDMGSNTACNPIKSMWGHKLAHFLSVLLHF